LKRNKTAYVKFQNQDERIEGDSVTVNDIQRSRGPGYIIATDEQKSLYGPQKVPPGAWKWVTLGTCPFISFTFTF